MAAVHVSPFSGTWYPAAPAELDRLLEERFEISRQRTGPYLLADGMGFVVPHAAPEYSGVVAASVYRSLRQQNPERIVLLAFPHRGGIHGVAVPDVRAVSTPLGTVRIDGFRSEPFPRIAERLVCDHSFEIQLPFLQKAAPNSRICPLYVGPMSEEQRRATAETLAAEWRAGTVFLASSDFTHYGRGFGYVPFPADDRIADRLRALDAECIEAAGSVDSGLFLEALAKIGATVCGSDPIALLLSTLSLIRPDGVFQSTLDYQTSGELTGDCHHSVSYAALGYFGRSSFDLAAPDGDELLTSAELTLQRLRNTGRRDPVRPRGGPALESRRGVFVSLHRNSELLGCMGHCEARTVLAEAVPELALVAALEDPRFRPGDAVAGPFEVEVSVLTPLRLIRGAAGFRLGQHGALLRLGLMGGLLLPQVARPDWTAVDFLEALARKSGLPKAAHQDPEARLSVFEAQVLRREKSRGKI
ncbi:MAG TPA: AmmeMemoRadiSam system protein B [Bryobacteraceae bacterium]|nr:AmmeMemoRadiSam system protein B [Bryobacteraceae bacterium]